MADQEVVNILREIRERVVEEVNARAFNEEEMNQSVTTDVHMKEAQSALARLQEHLAVTERARDRLPPVESNRSGFMAQLELWIKRKLKRATRWYAWEQVNFNSAVNQALRDLQDALTSYERALAEMNTRLDNALSTQQSIAQLATHLEAIDARLSLLENRASDEKETEWRAGFDEALAQVRADQQQQAERISAEQRVVFKQLLLEINESAAQMARLVMIERARLDALSERLEELRSVQAELEQLRSAAPSR